MARSPKHGHSKKPAIPAILAVIAAGGTITEAAEATGVSYVTIHKWKRNDPGFKAQFAEAYQQGTDVFLQEMKRRAVDGVEEPVFYQGVECGKVRKYSDTLLVTALKMRTPESFVEYSKSEHTGKDGSPLFTGITRKIVKPANNTA